jgi:hypothetical protein
MDAKTAKNHVTFVGVLHIGFGALNILGAVIVFFVFNYLTGFITEIPEAEEIPVELLGWIKGFTTILLGTFGLIDILAGALLFTYKNGARIFMLVISAINCLNIPIGTAKGVYSIWVLMQKEVMELFESE